MMQRKTETGYLLRDITKSELDDPKNAECWRLVQEDQKAFVERLWLIG